MNTVFSVLSSDHRRCDERFAEVEQAVAAAAWDDAERAFARLRDAMQCHFDAEETLLFPAFEAQTGMRSGPTQVMRDEHAQMRGLLAAAKAALDERTADDYSGVAETLLIMMQQHNMKEENVLYPMCDQQLSSQIDLLLPQLQSRIAGDQEQK